MKAYTDISQSKKLAEILPIESADMAWYPSYAKEGYSIRMLNDIYPLDIIGEEHDEIPAWSLAALVHYLSSCHLISPDPGETIYYCRCDGQEISSNSAIDAVFEMTLKLHEQKLL